MEAEGSHYQSSFDFGQSLCILFDARRENCNESHTFMLGVGNDRALRPDGSLHVCNDDTLVSQRPARFTSLCIRYALNSSSISCSCLNKHWKKTVY